MLFVIDSVWTSLDVRIWRRIAQPRASIIIRKMSFPRKNPAPRKLVSTAIEKLLDTIRSPHWVIDLCANKPTSFASLSYRNIFCICSSTIRTSFALFLDCIVWLAAEHTPRTYLADLRYPKSHVYAFRKVCIRFGSSTFLELRVLFVWLCWTDWKAPKLWRCVALARRRFISFDWVAL